MSTEVKAMEENMEREAEEVWKVVEGYPLYRVSNFGGVRVIGATGKGRRRDGRMLRPFMKKNGYMGIKLVNDNGEKHFHVHIMVATAFIPNPEGYETVDHANFVKHDNRAVNLSWCTQKENNRRAIEAGRWEHRMRPVRQIDEKGDVIAVYRSLSDAARAVEGCASSILKCANGGRKTVKTYRWEFDV
jgi:NUMOD4 motif/HNH endonuclease